MRSLCDIYDVCCSYLKNLHDICRYLTFVVDVEINVVIVGDPGVKIDTKSLKAEFHIRLSVSVMFS